MNLSNTAPDADLPAEAFVSYVCTKTSVSSCNAASGGNPMPDLEDYVTRAQLCAALKIHRETVRRWAHSGKLPAYAFGRCLRYRRSDVERLLSEARWSRKKKPRPKAKASNQPAWGVKQP